MNRSDERVFEHAAPEVASARHFVSDTFAAWGLADGEAQLAISELATNAVQHAGTLFTVRITRLAAQVRVEVADGGPLLPAPCEVSDTEERGRGLQIVRAVTNAWGMNPADPGKTIWFTVPAVPAVRRS